MYGFITGVDVSANLNMWVHDIPFGQTRFETRGHIVRLLIQIILILGCLWISRRLKGARAQARMQRHKTQLKNSDFFLSEAPSLNGCMRLGRLP